MACELVEEAAPARRMKVDAARARVKSMMAAISGGENKICLVGEEINGRLSFLQNVAGKGKRCKKEERTERQEGDQICQLRGNPLENNQVEWSNKNG